MSKAPIKIHIQREFLILDRTCIGVNRERHNHFLFRGLLPLLVKLVHHQERENWPNQNYWAETVECECNYKTINANADVAL